MDLNKTLLIAIDVLALVYSLFYLYQGRKVKVVLKSNNKLIIYLFFLLLAILVFIKGNIITSCIIIISGIILSFVPSGYDEKGIYISGRFYSFAKISDMSFDEVNGYYQLSFTYHGKSHVLIADSSEKDKLKGAMYFSKQQQNVNK